MAWETKHQHRTLFIRRIAKDKLRIDQMIAVRTQDGVNYVEPMPSETMGLRSMEFDDVQFVDGPFPVIRSAQAGQHNLTSSNSDGLEARTG